MDSQDSSAAAPPPPPLLPHSHHPSQQPFHYQHQTTPMGPPQSHANSFSAPTSNNIMSPHQQQQQQQNQPPFPFNSMVSSGGPQKVEFSDGNRGEDSSPQTNGTAAGFSIDTGKKKRGRPRKYSPDGQGNNIALGLSPSPATPGSSAAVTGSCGRGGTLSSEDQLKKHRGRPPGSGKKQLDALGVAGVGFTPHVITVNAGEDIASKIVAFTQQGPRTVCVLSANGSICNVTLRQPATSGGTVTYEGRFEIISLSGSFLLSEHNGSRSRTGGLSVSLAGSDGRVLGGGVAGMLVAATPVQVVLGSFIQDGKKTKSAASPVSAATTAPNTSPTPAPASNMLSFGNHGTVVSPPSQVASSYSSDDNGSPVNQGPYANSSQPMQNVPIYANMNWGNTTINMHPN